MLLCEDCGNKRDTDGYCTTCQSWSAKSLQFPDSGYSEEDDIREILWYIYGGQD